MTPIDILDLLRGPKETHVQAQTFRYGKRHPTNPWMQRVLMRLQSSAPIPPGFYESVIVRPEYTTKIDFYERGPLIRQRGLFLIKSIVIGCIPQMTVEEKKHGIDAYDYAIPRDRFDTTMSYQDTVFVIENTSIEPLDFEAELSGWADVR